MKKAILIALYLVFMLFSANLKAQDFNSELFKAEKLYANSSYDSAALIYQSIIDSGYQSPELYYNLANTYYKLQEIPSAILYFEKALKLNPSDENIKHNLELCNSMIPDRIEAVPRLFFIDWYRSLYNYFPIDTWASIGLSLFALFSFLLLIYFLSSKVFLKKLGFWAASFILILSLFSFFLTYQKYESFIQHDEAIIFIPSITVKSSPAKNSVDLFVIHEGTKVTIIDQVGLWMEIKIQNGSTGWIESENLQII